MTTPKPNTNRPARVSWRNFMASITHHMGRVHVGVPDSEVEADIRVACGKFRTKGSMSKATENACVRFALELHHENQRLYRWVMGGTK